MSLAIVGRYKLREPRLSLMVAVVAFVFMWGAEMITFSSKTPERSPWMVYYELLMRTLIFLLRESKFIRHL